MKNPKMHSHMSKSKKQGLMDGAKVSQHKALAMGIKPAQGIGQSSSGHGDKTGKKSY